ncbi:MAG: hypothetical protein AB1305_01210 [Candidatus Hadarchaeota archaeon]
MKVLIQGMGEVPITAELAMTKEKPDVTYVLCSDYQLTYVHPDYKKPNKDVITDVARKSNTKLVFKRCDVFDPKAIRDCLADILYKVDPSKDEIIVNYTGGSAPVRLFLGMLGVQLSKFSPKTKILYAISYKKEGLEVVNNHAEKLKELLPTDIDLLLELFKPPAHHK